MPVDDGSVVRLLWPPVSVDGKEGVVRVKMLDEGKAEDGAQLEAGVQGDGEGGDVKEEARVADDNPWYANLRLRRGHHLGWMRPREQPWVYM